MKRRENPDVARLLLHRACEDERTIALIANANGPWSVGCFHCQQAAEKRLKALLAIREGHFPRTHDIGQLIELAEPHCVALKSLPDEASLLADYAVGVRYDDEMIADQAMFEQNMQWLEMIRTALQPVLDEEGL